MAITHHAGRRIQATSADVAEVYRGETPVTDGSDTVITFLQDGKFTPTSSFNVEYLVVAGGGQGGQSNAGGGGAGGYLANNSKSHGVTAQDYTITVGGKGTSAGSISQRGTAGENSSIVPTSGTSFISIGGGGGGSEQANPETGGNGGSGGGGNGYAGAQNASNGLGGTGTSGQGNAGGNGSSGGGATWRGGGGGGSASAGANGSVSGNGGNGTQNDISGTNTYYSAGGGGGCYQGTAGSGGTGGGGNGSQTGVGGHATTYGSGGGGSDNGGGSNAGGNGGDGIVIIRFATSESYNTLTGKPTNVQEGSRFEETDTRKMYNYVVPSLTLQDDFSSDNWVGGDSKNIVSGNSLNFDMRRDGSNDSATRDITSLSVSDEKWVLRFKLNFTVANTGGNGNRFYFGLSSSANTVGQNTAQDAIMLYQNHDVDDKVGACDADGAVLPQVNTTTVSYATGTDYYCEIARTSTTTYTVKMWTGSYGGTEFANELGTCSATLAGLNYIKISNHDASNISTWNELTGTIDDIEFYNGVTQATNYWQELGT